MDFYRGYSFCLNTRDIADADYIYNYFRKNYDLYLYKSISLRNTHEEAKQLLDYRINYNQVIVKYSFNCEQLRSWMLEMRPIKAHSIEIYRSGINDRNLILLTTKVF